MKLEEVAHQLNKQTTGDDYITIINHVLAAKNQKLDASDWPESVEASEFVLQPCPTG